MLLILRLRPSVNEPCFMTILYNLECSMTSNSNKKCTVFATPYETVHLAIRSSSVSNVTDDTIIQDPVACLIYFSMFSRVCISPSRPVMVAPATNRMSIMFGTSAIIVFCEYMSDFKSKNMEIVFLRAFSKRFL